MHQLNELNDFNDFAMLFTAPPALPLDVSTKKDVRELEGLVDKLIDKESQRAKRQGWIHYGKKKEAKEAKKQLEDQAEEMEYSQGKLERIYEKVKRLASLAKSSRNKDTTAEAKKDDVIISDSGDVGSKMLAKVKKIIAEKNAKVGNGMRMLFSSLSLFSYETKHPRGALLRKSHAFGDSPHSYCILALKLSVPSPSAFGDSPLSYCIFTLKLSVPSPSDKWHLRKQI